MPKLINPSLAAAFCAAFLDVPVPCAMIALSRLHVAFQRGVVRVPGPGNDLVRLLKALVEQRKVTCRLMAVTAQRWRRFLI